MLECEKKISTPIHHPLTGKHARPWPKLENIPKLTDWSSMEGGFAFFVNHLHTVKPGDDRSFRTLRHRIIFREVKWGCVFKINGKFCQTPKYREWAEEILSRYPSTLGESRLYDVVHASLFTYSRDQNIMRSFYEAWCPGSNTLHTSGGEVSITPWDLHVFGGLPIIGEIYDKTTPFPNELHNTIPDEDSRSPASCRYLLSAFHKLAAGERRNGITPAAWVKYWFKGNQNDKSSSSQSRKKFVPPTHTGSSSGNVNEVDNWSLAIKDVFPIMLALYIHIPVKYYINNST